MDNIKTNLDKVEMTWVKRFLAGLINAVLSFTIIVPILNLYFMLTKGWSIGSKLMGYGFEAKDDTVMYILLATISVAFFWPIMLIVNLVFLSQDSKLATEKFSSVKFSEIK